MLQPGLRRPAARPSTRPNLLYLFAISHYCEKARWALEHLAIPCELRYLAPGLHVADLLRIGAGATTLPLLQTPDGLVQGSSAIIDWAQQVWRSGAHDATSDTGTPGATSDTGTPPRAADDADRSLEPAGDADAAREIERRLDEVLGVHVRRYFYSEALVERPDTVRPVFSEPLDGLARLYVQAAWPAISAGMIATLDLGRRQFEESGAIIEGELDWLDGLLGAPEDQAFLLGERLSRVDITAAALLAPLVLPPEHPEYARVEPPPKVAADMARWRDRTSLRWARRLYREHRRPTPPVPPAA